MLSSKTHCARDNVSDYSLVNLSNMYALYLARERHALRRERLFRGRLNPLEKYDYVEIKRLFRFERPNIIQIVDDLRLHIMHPTSRNKALSP